MAWASGEYLLHHKMHSTYDMYDTGFNANLLMHKNSMYFLSLKNNALSIHRIEFFLFWNTVLNTRATQTKIHFVESKMQRNGLTKTILAVPIPNYFDFIHKMDKLLLCTDQCCFFTQIGLFYSWCHASTKKIERLDSKMQKSQMIHVQIYCMPGWILYSQTPTMQH